MRVLVARLFVLAALTPIFAMRVDGILVHGRTNDVSRADIREALATEPMAHPSEVVVLSSSEMRIYFGTHDEGWSPMVRGPVIEPSGKIGLAHRHDRYCVLFLCGKTFEHAEVPLRGCHKDASGMQVPTCWAIARS